MASAIIEDTMSETGHDLAAIVRAGCFVSEADALREAVQTLLTRQVRNCAWKRRFGGIWMERSRSRRASEIAGVTRWWFQELLALCGLRVTLETRPAKDLDEAVERIRRRRQ